MNARSRETQIPVGPLIAALGAVLLIVSLGLDWYGPLSGFNTAIAAVMELTNEIYRQRSSAPVEDVRFAIATAGSLIFPFAPHLGSEVYELMTGRRVWEEPWPQADPALLERDEIQLVVQVNGKLIDRLAAPATATSEQLEELARGSDKLATRLNGKEIVKTVIVPGKLVNFVIR